MNNAVGYGTSTLPVGVRSRYIDGHDARLHVLESGFDAGARPTVLRLHGFPELAYSWRKQLLPLARAGFHVLAPDLRGYGLSSGAGVSFDADLGAFSPRKYVGDMLSILQTLGVESAVVVGHDWGSPVAAWCALAHPERFRAVVLMSSPFEGVGGSGSVRIEAIDTELASHPHPRKHYLRYYATREANSQMWHAPQGVHNFLRAYYHFKSADWSGNQPSALSSWSASELAKMPPYYIMDLEKGMAETVAPMMPSAAQIATCPWLSEAELTVCSDLYAGTGFQGGLQLYRVAETASYHADIMSFGRDAIDVPCCFIAGARDWGVLQSPGALEAMQTTGCRRLTGVHLIDHAGHWVQQEQADRVNEILIGFCQRGGG